VIQHLCTINSNEETAGTSPNGYFVIADKSVPTVNTAPPTWVRLFLLYLYLLLHPSYRIVELERWIPIEGCYRHCLIGLSSQCYKKQYAFSRRTQMINRYTVN
jgi:hypothetical protein